MKAQTAKTVRSENPLERAIQRHAIEAVIWGMPAVNFDLLYQAALKAGAAFNQVVYWSRLPNWKNQTLTPNPDTIYFFPFINTRDAGPMVIEIPAADDGSITGSIDDCWQTAMEDVGPAGVDKGKGGKYVILPPGHRDKIPAGYIPMQSGTYQSYVILRSNLASGSDADVAKAVTYGKRVKVYPLSKAAAPPKTLFVDAVDVVYDNTIPYYLRFFQSLHRMVQVEPWLERDKAMIDILKSIGIEKGKPFDPDTKMKKLLNDAAADAHAYLESRYEYVFQPPFDSTARWALPASKELVAAMQSNFAQPDVYPTEARGLAYSYAYFSPKHMGEGQFYLMTIKDKAGNDLDGASSYWLHVPPNPPVRLYWSATVYDRATITLPDAGNRFMTIIVIDEDHYVFTVAYGAGTVAFMREKMGTRYALAAVRILVDPNDPKDIAQVNALQDGLKVDQPGGPGRFEVPNWDPASHKKVRDALTVLGETIPDWRHAAGRRGEVDPIRHLIVTATGWGLNPEKDAMYLNITPKQNDGGTNYKLTVKDVPVDGFWSISLYGAYGFFHKNKFEAYTFNSITAKKSNDGSVTIHFGGCDGEIENCLPIMAGWNYTVRLYRPRKEILDGTWVFPEAKPVP